MSGGQLRENELLVLITLLEYDVPLTVGRTARELLCEIGAHPEYRDGAKMTPEESADNIRAARACMAAHPAFGEYRIVRSRAREKNRTAPAAVFASGRDAVCVFWGTTGAEEWYDNVIAGDEAEDVLPIVRALEPETAEWAISVLSGALKNKAQALLTAGGQR